jgi:hypothetical protein
MGWITRTLIPTLFDPVGLGPLRYTTWAMTFVRLVGYYTTLSTLVAWFFPSTGSWLANQALALLAALREALRAVAATDPNMAALGQSTGATATPAGLTAWMSAEMAAWLTALGDSAFFFIGSVLFLLVVAQGTLRGLRWLTDWRQGRGITTVAGFFKRILSAMVSSTTPWSSYVSRARAIGLDARDPPLVAVSPPPPHPRAAAARGLQSLALGPRIEGGGGRRPRRRAGYRDRSHIVGLVRTPSSRFRYLPLAGASVQLDDDEDVGAVDFHRLVRWRVPADMPSRDDVAHHLLHDTAF